MRPALWRFHNRGGPVSGHDPSAFRIAAGLIYLLQTCAADSTSPRRAFKFTDPERAIYVRPDRESGTVRTGKPDAGETEPSAKQAPLSTTGFSVRILFADADVL
jgi:hypothetical protein